MRLKILIISLLSILSAVSPAQESASINLTDKDGRKQGEWIKKYPNGNIQYQGVFKDDHPVGKFIRYNENSSLQTVLIHSDDGKTAEAIHYHTDGVIASKGKYVNQKKEGTWKFYSAETEGYLICEEDYSKGVRNGESRKFYPDSSLIEKVRYVNDKKEGELVQYHPNGRIYFRAFYSKGLLNGKFEAWYENGKPELSGTYKNNYREGKWFIFNNDGSLRYELDYKAGITRNRLMDIETSDFLDKVEKNSGKIADPEKTDVIR